MVTLPLTCLCHSFALLPAAGNYHRCDYHRSSSPSPVSIITFFRNTCPGPVLPRGAAVCTATVIVNAWTIFSIIYRFLLGALVTLCRNVYRSSPWIQRSPDTTQPHILPLGGRGKERGNKKTLYGTIIHDREVLAPLSFPKQASSP